MNKKKCYPPSPNLINPKRIIRCEGRKDKFFFVKYTMKKYLILIVKDVPSPILPPNNLLISFLTYLVSKSLNPS